VSTNGCGVAFPTE